MRHTFTISLVASHYDALCRHCSHGNSCFSWPIISNDQSDKNAVAEFRRLDEVRARRPHHGLPHAGRLSSGIITTRHIGRHHNILPRRKAKIAFSRHIVARGRGITDSSSLCRRLMGRANAREPPHKAGQLFVGGMPSRAAFTPHYYKHSR